MDKNRSERLHDLHTVQADFKATLGLIKAGYRFEDAEGKAALLQLEKALAILAGEIERLSKEWR